MTAEALPPPPVAPDTDLRHYPYMPIFRSRLLGSVFHATTTDAEWRAGVILWLKSWDQVPAGSLPDNDSDLSRLAELGRDMKAWKRIRPGAMRGWSLHSDGRLYHPVVTEGVLEAWTKRATASAKGKAGAAARWAAEHARTKEMDMAQASQGDGTGIRKAWHRHQKSMAQASNKSCLCHPGTMAQASVLHACAIEKHGNR